jgi:hypothetical protein
MFHKVKKLTQIIEQEEQTGKNVKLKLISFEQQNLVLIDNL